MASKPHQRTKKPKKNSSLTTCLNPTLKPTLKRNDKLPSELYELEQIVGEFMHYWGFKAIHGRIWAHLFVSAAPLDSLELMRRLRVSKGLMSLALRELLDYDVIQNDHVGKHGTTFYKPNPEIIKVISNVLKKRELEMLKRAHHCSLNLKKALEKVQIKAQPISSTQVDHVIEITQTAEFLLAAFLSQDHENPYSLLFNSQAQ